MHHPAEREARARALRASSAPHPGRSRAPGGSFFSHRGAWGNAVVDMTGGATGEVTRAEFEAAVDRGLLDSLCEQAAAAGPAAGPAPVVPPGPASYLLEADSDVPPLSPAVVRRRPRLPSSGQQQSRPRVSSLSDDMRSQRLSARLSRLSTSSSSSAFSSMAPEHMKQLQQSFDSADRLGTGLIDVPTAMSLLRRESKSISGGVCCALQCPFLIHPCLQGSVRPGPKIRCLRRPRRRIPRVFRPSRNVFEHPPFLSYALSLT
jgi:hypothetical protein